MGWKEGDYFDGVDDELIRKEKGRARELRKSRWWQNKLAAGRCYYCGQTIESSRLTMDHVVPLAKGGRSEKNNLVACCKECNTKKKTMLPQEWQDYMEGLEKE
jgi:5-methylcytosine-specific restriction endonuclease McrA